MSETKSMHYVPQTYLKNFSKQKGNSYFIDALPAESSNSSDIKSINIKKVCAVNNLYALPGDTVEERQLIEKMFSELYEKNYNKLYALLTDPNRETITIEERYDIIAFVVAMFFRNISWYNFFYRINDDMIERGYHMTKENGKDAFFINDEKIIITGKTVEEIKKEMRERDKVLISTVLVEKISQLIWIRLQNDIITVIELNDNNEFITSDNPVYCKGEIGKRVIPMNPANALTIAIDNKHLVQLRPWANEHDFDIKTLWRMDESGIVSYATTLSYNDAQVSQTSRFVLGSDSGLKKHLAKIERYSKAS
jgi:hypothetical protein